MRFKTTLLSFGLVFFALHIEAQQNRTKWTFAVSGDSRNCGDVVVPVLAQEAARANARFYWHLGDFRALSDIDQDIQRQVARAASPLTVTDYRNLAWDDFIQHQLHPFAHTPVFLGIGNHELYGAKTRADYIAQFADWINADAIRTQRLADDPNDHRVKTYYHWQQDGIEFISLDNASKDQFDAAQMRWFEDVLKRIEHDAKVKSIVVGMHEALPDSIAASHSMNDWADGEKSGRQVYMDLLTLRKSTNKNVYILASHSHFYMAGIFDTQPWRTRGGVLPGWIIGTAGAVRYDLPAAANTAIAAKTNVYGLLLGNVHNDGSIDFQFHEVREGDVPVQVQEAFASGLVHECFVDNSNAHAH